MGGSEHHLYKILAGRDSGGFAEYTDRAVEVLGRGVVDSIVFRDDKMGASSPTDLAKFLDYLVGGEERLTSLRAFLAKLKDLGCKVHVSSRGVVSEVVAVLSELRMLAMFTSVDGFDDKQESRVTYRVAQGTPAKNGRRSWHGLQGQVIANF